MAAPLEVESSSTLSRCTPRGIDTIMADMLRENASAISESQSNPDREGEDGTAKYTFGASAQAIIDKLTRMSGMTGDNGDLSSDIDPSSAIQIADLLNEHSQGGEPIGSSTCVEANVDLPPENPKSAAAAPQDTKPANAEQVATAASFKEKATAPYPSEATAEWVNYQYDRLVSERKKIPSPYMERTLEIEPKSELMAAKSIAEIMKEYGSDSTTPARNDRSASSTPSSLQRGSKVSRHFDLFRTVPGRINTSQNNETLSSGSEVDQLRRIGSSVDSSADGDFMKGFKTKSSFSNHLLSRSKTSLGANTLTTASEAQNRPGMVTSESNVDYKQIGGAAVNGELSEFKSDLPTLNNTFMKERERLRQIETLIKKTPVNAYSGIHEFQSWKSGSYYRSRFIPEKNSEFSGMKAWSAMDYRTSLDWRSMSPSRSREYLNRTYSSPSYRNLGQYSSSSNGRYVPREPSPPQYPIGLDEPNSSSVDTSYARHQPNADANTPFTSPRSASYFLKEPTSSRMNIRPFDVKKNRNMSKSMTESHQNKISDKSQKPKSLATDTPRRTDKQSSSSVKGKASRDFNSSRSAEKRCDKPKSSLSSSKSNNGSSLKEPNKRSKQRLRSGSKYQLYQPYTDPACCPLKRVQSDHNAAGHWQLMGYGQMNSVNNSCLSDQRLSHCNNSHGRQQAWTDSPNCQLRAVAKGLLSKKDENLDRGMRSKSECRDYTWSESLSEECPNQQSDGDTGGQESLTVPCLAHPTGPPMKDRKTKVKKATKSATKHKMVLRK